MDDNTLKALHVVLEAARRYLDNAGDPMKQYGGRAYEIVEQWITDRANKV